MNATRLVLPELLDELPQDSPAARASRRDLKIVNYLLRNQRWIVSLLRDRGRIGECVLELGAGSGELGKTLNTVVPRFAGLDLARRPFDWPVQAPWFETDVMDFALWNDYPIVIANLFFHHFDSRELARLGAQLGDHARLIIACDPLRIRRAERLFSLLCPLIRAHPVTQYDGRVSIAAGFRDEELPRLLQLDPLAWRWRVEETFLGASRLVAERRP